MSFSRRTREASKDIVSDLPDPILGHILSFLSTKDAFRTSILSRRWKHIFTHTPNLHFDDGQKHQKLKDSSKMHFIYFGYKMLLVRPTNSPVHRLCLRLGVVHDSELINTWISYAVQHGARELDLEFAEGVSGVFSLNLCSCATLVVLKLDGSLDLQVPDTVCFPSMEVLHLRSIRFSDNNVAKKLFSASNALRQLKVDGCSFGPDGFLDISIPTLRWLELRMCHKLKFSIDAPRLGCFTYTGSVRVGFSFRNTESLGKADIDIWQTPRGVSLDNFYGAFSAVKYLRLSSSSMKCVSVRRPCLPIFHKLHNLELGPCSDKSGRSLQKVLTNSPHLRLLVFPQGLYRADRLRLGKPKPETPQLKTFFLASPKAVPTCLSLFIREIKIMQFNGCEVEFLLLEYFMKHALVLEKLIIEPTHIPGQGVDELGGRLNSLYKKLHGLQKISRLCRINLT